MNALSNQCDNNELYTRIRKSILLQLIIWLINYIYKILNFLKLINNLYN